MAGVNDNFNNKIKDKTNDGTDRINKQNIIFFASKRLRNSFQQGDYYSFIVVDNLHIKNNRLIHYLWYILFLSHTRGAILYGKGVL